MNTTRRSTAPSRISLALACALLVLSSAVHPASGQTPVLEGLDEWIEAEMARWRIPGLAVAIVKDDAVAYARGFGVRRLGEAAPVDEHTLFGVASTTKAMTATVLGMLVDEGLLDWDDPVVKHLPGFRLSDPSVTDVVTVRDLLTHRVGVGRIAGNRLRYLSNRTREEVLYRMRFHEFEEPFRSGYVYSNVMYALAGEVVGAVSGMSWEEFMRRRIFEPLGMERSSTSVDAIGPEENAAWPHQEIDGEVQPISRRDWHVVAPSAAVNTSVLEMAEWMRLNLGEAGVHAGRRLVSEATMREIFRPQVTLGGNALDGSPFTGYGLGWNLRAYEGRWIAQHGGATDGMNTMLMLVPSERLGVVVMTNTFNDLMTALAQRVVDTYLGLPDRGWGDTYRIAYERVYAAARSRREAIHAGRIEGTRPARPLADYAGTYVDSLYVDAVVRLEGGGLVLQLWDDPEMVADLEHWHYETFRAVWRNRSMREEWVWFTPGPDGRPDALHVQWALRPVLLQVGAYPTDYYRVVRFERAGAQEHPSASPEGARDLLEARQRAFTAALATRDEGAIAELFAEGAVVHVANMPPIEGRTAIGTFFGNMFRFLSASRVVPETTERSRSGDLAYEVGRTENEFRGADGPVTYEGKYVLVWRMLGNEWMVAYYGVSSNQADATR